MFHLAQALTGHGCFQAYLYVGKRAQDLGCSCCPEVWDDVDHTIFVCPHFEHSKLELVCLLGRTPGPDDVEAVLYGDAKVELLQNDAIKRHARNWEKAVKSALLDMVAAVLRTKKKDER